MANIYRHAFDDYNVIVIRYGSKEFVAVAFSLEQKNALKLGERICRLAVDAGIPDSEGGVVTVSISEE